MTDYLKNCQDLYFLVKYVVNNTIKQGIAIYLSSLIMTRIPHSEKNSSTPIGDTCITRYGKKYLEFSNGIKKPTPLPPVVIASNTPCESVERNNTIMNISFLCFPKKKDNKTLQIKAKAIECVKPLCPKGCRYSIPNLKAKTSTSGSIEDVMAKNNKSLVVLDSITLVTVKATNPCPKIDAITAYLLYQ